MRDFWEKQNIKCAIFDLDGTLLDSLSVWKQVDMAFLSKRGVYPPPDYMKDIAHLDFKKTAEYTVARFGFTDTPEQLMEEWRSLSKVAYEEEVLLKPHTKELLTSLKDRGIKLGVSTSLVKNLYEPCLKRNGILDMFEAFSVAGGEIRGKEYPDVYLNTARLLGEKPENCAVFEDIAVGIKVARSVGFFTVGVSDEHCDDPETLKNACHLYIENFADII